MSVVDGERMRNLTKGVPKNGGWNRDVCCKGGRYDE
jgi:hypothetical protein